MNQEQLLKFIEHYDFEGLARVFAESNVKWHAKEWKEFIKKVLSNEKERKHNCEQCEIDRKKENEFRNFEPPHIEDWEKELAEYGQLHNEDCCVNFTEDSRACDVGTGDVDCCENMQMIAEFIRSLLSKEKELCQKEVQKAQENGCKNGKLSVILYLKEKLEGMKRKDCVESCEVNGLGYHTKECDFIPIGYNQAIQDIIKELL